MSNNNIILYICSMDAGKQHIKFSKDQVDKIGNTLIYIQKKLGYLAKTKALKLLYILDELSISRYGIPFVNLEYRAWKLGPVNPEMYYAFTKDPEFDTSSGLLADYISIKYCGDGSCVIETIKDFNDDEFSKVDIDLLNLVIDSFAKKPAVELIDYTHRPNSPWDIAVQKHCLELDFEFLGVNITDYELDMSELIKGDPSKTSIYNQYKELF